MEGMSQEQNLANSYFNQKTSQFKKKKKSFLLIKYVKPKNALKTL